MPAKNKGYAILILLGVAVTVAGADAIYKAFEFFIPNYGSISESDSDKSVRAFAESYHTMAATLAAQVDDRKITANDKVYPIYLLGILRSYEVAPRLVRNIDIKVDRIDPKLDIARWGEYPVVDALVKIGLPAVREIIGKLPREVDPTRRKLMITVLLDVDGAKIARIRLEDTLSSLSNEDQKNNLKAAIALISTK